MSSSVVDFEGQVERRLSSVVSTQESIQSVSLWAIHHKAQHQAIVNVWLRVLRSGRSDLRLSLFHLCNEILQTCKRRNAYSFKESFRKVLKEALPLVRGSQIRSNVTRILQIWIERNVYEEDFIEELLKALHEHKQTKPNDDAKLLADFQPKSLIEAVGSFNAFSHQLEVTKKFHKPSHHDAKQIESIQLRIKDDSSCADECRDALVEMRRTLREEILTLESVSKRRMKLLELLQLAEIYYDNEYSDVSVIVQAYKNYGNRSNNLKLKLSEHRNLIPDPRPQSKSESVTSDSKIELDEASTSQQNHIVKDKSFASSSNDSIHKTDFESIFKNEGGFMTFLPRRIPSLGCQNLSDGLGDHSVKTSASDDGGSTPVQDEPPDPMEFLSQIINKSTYRSNDRWLSSAAATDPSTRNMKSSEGHSLAESLDLGDGFGNFLLTDSVDYSRCHESHLGDGIHLNSGANCDQQIHASVSSAVDQGAFNDHDHSCLSEDFVVDNCYDSSYGKNFQSQRSYFTNNLPDSHSMSMGTNIEFPTQNYQSSSDGFPHSYMT